MIDHAATLALAASASVILRLDRILEALPMGQPALSRNPYEHARSTAFARTAKPEILPKAPIRRSILGPV
jgi:hypothetical protein